MIDFSKIDEAPPSITLTSLPLFGEEGASKPGEKFRGVFVGIKEERKGVTENGELIIKRIAYFLGKGNILYTHMGVMLLRVVQGILPGTVVEIEFTGKEKTSNGHNVKKYNVVALDVPRVDLMAEFGGTLTLPAPEEHIFTSDQHTTPEALPAPAE